MGLTAQHGLNYGRVRLWGSVAFILSGATAGWLLAGRPADFVLIFIVGALGLTLLACLLLPDERAAAMPSTDAGWIALLSSRRFVTFLLASGLIQSSHAVFYGFGSLHWLAAGHDKDAVGVLWAVGVIAEVALFAAGRGVVARLGPAWLLVLAGVAGILRWSAAGLSTELAVLAVVQLLHGLTFGAAHLAAMYYLVHEVPAGLATTAQGLYGAFAWGAAFGLTMLAAGGLYAAIAGGAFFVMAGMSLAGAVAALALTGSRH
jgi:PPP family 3-phenylpropionic acid transporter